MALKGGQDISSFFCGVDVASEFLEAGDFLKRAILSNNGMVRLRKPKFAFYKPVLNTKEDASSRSTSVVTQSFVVLAGSRRRVL